MGGTMYRGATIWARKTLESEVFFLKPDKWFKIWFYLVSKVNHEDKGKFKKGETLVRYADISEACGATKSQVDHAIRWFKKSKMLATRKATRGMFATVLKYNTYQNLDSYGSDDKSDLKAKQKRNRSDTINKNEKNVKNEKKKNTVFPPSLKDPKFIEVWEEWKQHRTEKKNKLTPTTIKKQLEMLSKYSIPVAIATIEKSIQNGWQGLFPEKESDKPKPPAAQTKESKNKQLLTMWENDYGTWIRAASLEKMRTHPTFSNRLKDPEFREWAITLNSEVKEVA